MKITGNEPATPFQSSELSGMNEAHYGLTIRQYFAAMAMQGMLSNSLINDFIIKSKGDLYEVSVSHADALIEELNKEK